MTRPNHEGVPRRSSADTGGEVARVLAKLEAGGNDLTITRIVANMPGAFRPFVLMADALFNRVSLPPLIRETVVLWLASRDGQSYEWAEHEPIARQAGVSDELIDALRRGQADPVTSEQRLAIDLAAQLVGTRRVSSSTWTAAEATWGLPGLLELVLSIGWWHGLVPVMLDALDLAEPDGQSSGELGQHLVGPAQYGSEKRD
jgi:4-carboxymuconolactone decarboxylase